MKKKIFIISGIVVILGVLIFLGVYSSRTNKVDNAVNNKEYLFFLKNEKDTPYSEVSVLNNSKVIELGQTALDEVYTLNDEGAFLLAQKDSTSKKDYNLIVVNKDRSKKVVGTISKEFLHSVKCLDGYIYYEEVSKDVDGNIVKLIVEVNPRVDGKVFPKVILNNINFVLYSNDKRIVGTNSKDELVSYDRNTKKEEVIGERYTSMDSNNEVALISNSGEITYYNLETGKKTLDPKKLTEVNGKIKGLYIEGYKDGKVIYIIDSMENSNTKQLYVKGKNLEPVLVSNDITDIQIIGDNILYTKDIKSGEKLEYEFIETSINNPSKSRMLLKSDYIKMKYKVIDSQGNIYAIAGKDSELYKISKDGNIEKLNNNVDYVAMQNGKLIYYKLGQQKNDASLIHKNVYDIYVDNKEVVKGVQKIYLLNNIIAYSEGNDFSIIKNGQVQKLNVDMSKYDEVLVSGGSRSSLYLSYKDI